MKTGPAPSSEPSHKAEGLFHLYVAGLGPQSVEAILKVRQEMERFHAASHTLRVFDVHQQPALLKSLEVRALPTLVRIAPQPRCVLLSVANGAGPGFWRSDSPPGC